MTGVEAEDTQLTSQFVDSNVFVYAHDSSAGAKRARAAELIEDLWRGGNGCLSVQVLQETHVNLSQKIPHPLENSVSRQIVDYLSRWRVHVPSPEDLLAAIDLQQRYSLSFWDSLIVRSASSLGCTILWTEDLNTGQVYDGVEARNPF